MPAHSQSVRAVTGRGSGCLLPRNATISATSGTSTVISTRTVCSFKSFSTSAPRYAPGSAPSMAHSAGFHSTLPLFMYFSVAESEPQQADILFVPAASVGESPAR